LMIGLSESDRALFVAPHPDDESLGGGGLLQRAFEAHIPVRILFVTNGDNNPWAQRFWERRWAIRAQDRSRWGNHRRQEALSAIAALGGSVECAEFLNFQDQSVTPLLMEGAAELVAALTSEIQAFQPTIAVIPTILDAHPDHSALGVALSLLFDSIGIRGLRVWEYLIHRPQAGIMRRPMVLRLNPTEIEKKRNAILCHRTQVKLSRSRFLRFARVDEAFYAHAPVGVESDARPILRAQIREEGVQLVIGAGGQERMGADIRLVFRFKGSQLFRRRIKIPFFSGLAPMSDAATGKALPDAVATWSDSYLTMEIPIFGALRMDALFVKFSNWKLFFDRSGWCQVVCDSSRSSKAGVRGVPNVLTQL
jgi:LmbE family N-acetylglucosaminyl deacetylase